MWRTLPLSRCCRNISITRAPWKGTRFLFAANKAGDLAVKLARAGKANGSLSILRSLLKVVPDPRPISDEMKQLRFTHEARSTIRDYEYSLVLQQNTVDLSEHLGIEFLNLLCDLLEEAFRIESRNTESANGRIEDYSYVWQTNLATSNFGRGTPKRLLASAVLTSAERISSKEQNSLSRVLSSLAKRRYTIFERVALQVLASKPEERWRSEFRSNVIATRASCPRARGRDMLLH